MKAYYNSNDHSAYTFRYTKADLGLLLGAADASSWVMSRSPLRAIEILFGLQTRGYRTAPELSAGGRASLHHGLVL